MVMIYRSKIDTWLLVVLVASIALSLAAAITMVVAGAPGAWIVAPVTAILGAGLPASVLFATRYVLEKNVLKIQSGPFRWSIPVDEIRGITPTSNPLSSPALSMDRLRIDYGRMSSVMISPLEKDRFISDVEAARSNAR